MSNLWTGAEVRVLTMKYPVGGTKACLPLLPSRSKVAIRKAAAELGLKRLGRKPGSGGRRASIVIFDELADLAPKVPA